jgi:NADH dehydrogenase [ubiquinone] 1 alpha subcomplex assembly factor 1
MNIIENMKRQYKLILDFSLPGEEKRWEITTDEVMGGVSQSQMSITSNKTAIFHGEVSLENYGGFASIRTRPQEYQLDGYAGLSLRVKGDGKKYRLRLRTDDAFEGIAYQAGFATQSEKWITVHLPFNEFIPVFRGRAVPDAPKLEAGHIRRIGFRIADKQAGPFTLEIEWVKAYKENNS